MFNFLKHKKDDPYIYKMLCKNCDIFFKVKDTYSLIHKETGKEIK